MWVCVVLRAPKKYIADDISQEGIRPQQYMFASGQEMTYVECPVPSGRESSKAWRYKQIPMYDPHSLLAYLFDEINLQSPTVEVRKYWQAAAESGCPWALRETGDRIPVKIFGDVCVYDERLTKAYGIVLSLPLWRPKSARNS